MNAPSGPITLKASLHGHEVLVTLRGVDFASIKAQVEQACAWLWVQAPGQASGTGEGWCHKHPLHMTLNAKQGHSWSSHRTIAGWCQGKEPTRRGAKSAPHAHEEVRRMPDHAEAPRHVRLREAYDAGYRAGYRDGAATACTPPFTNFVPIIIPTFNNPTFLKSMVKQLEALNCVNIMIVDNASTFPAMRRYLEQLSRSIEVLYMPDNAGPRRVWTDAAFFTKLPQVFCVTDPDLQLNAAMPLNFTDRLYALSEKYKMGKVGLALDIADVQALREDDYRIGNRDYKIWEWESQFWKTEVEPDIFVALVDTTFALYNKQYFDPSAPLNALRVGGAFTCQHLPWLKSCSLPDDEVTFYRKTNRHSYYLANVDSGPPKS